MDWKLISKKEVQTRAPFECHDCKKEYPAGAYAKNFKFKKEQMYRTKKVCEDCEKYYRTKDLQI